MDTDVILEFHEILHPMASVEILELNNAECEWIHSIMRRTRSRRNYTVNGTGVI